MFLTTIVGLCHFLLGIRKWYYSNYLISFLLISWNVSTKKNIPYPLYGYPEVLHTGKTDTRLILSFYLPGFRIMNWFCNILWRYPMRLFYLSIIMSWNLTYLMCFTPMQLLFFIWEAFLIWLLCHFVITHSYLVASSFSGMARSFRLLLYIFCYRPKNAHFCEKTLVSFYAGKIIEDHSLGTIRYCLGTFSANRTRKHLF